MPYKKSGYHHVYMILNTQTGCVYVGSTSNIERRMRDHFRLLTQGKHHSPKLQRSWDKHGHDAFVMAEIASLASNINLIELEQHYINALCAFGDKGYNILQFAGVTRGYKRKPYSAETIARMSAAQTGRKHSQETKDKISAANKGKKRSAEQCARNSESHKGKKLSADTIAKRSEKITGRKMPPRTEEWRRSQSEKLKGRKSEKAMPVIVNGVEYRSKTEAMRILKCSFRTLKKIASSGF